MNAPLSTVELDDKGRTRIGDNLFYVHQTTGEHFISVTSVTDGLSDGPLGDYWKPDMAALAALDNLPKLIRATRTKDCGRTWSKCRSGEDGHDWRERCDACPCGECAPCVRLWLRDEHKRRSAEARGRGSAVHDWIERWILGGGGVPVEDLHTDYQPYARAFLLFVADYGLTAESWELAEAKVINRTHGWGGTTDGAIRFDATATKKARELCERIGNPAPLLLHDWKSRENEDASFYPENGLQVGTYRRAEWLLLPDGSELPMPATDGAIVVQLHSDATYDLRPVSDTDEDYERGFLTRLAAKRWELQRAHAIVSVWHHQRDERGAVVKVADETTGELKPVRVTTFPKIADYSPPKPAKTAPSPRKRIFTDEERDAAIARDEAKLITPKGGAKAKAAAERAEAREQATTARKATVAASRARKGTSAPVQPALDEPAQTTVAEAVVASARAFAKANGARPGYLPDDEIPF